MPVFELEPGKIMIMLVPMLWMMAWEARLEPSPMPIIAMTAPTPMMMPSMVSAARSLFAPSARNASATAADDTATGMPVSAVIFSPSARSSTGPLRKPPAAQP